MKISASKLEILIILTLYLLLDIVISLISPVVTRGEGREGLVIKAMNLGSSLILPLRHGVEVPSKPPLFHWIGSLASEINLGVTPFTIRTGTILGVLLIIAGIYYFFKNFLPKNISLLIVLVTISSLEFIRYSTQARVDILFSAFIFLSTLSLYYYFEKTSKQILTALLSIIFLSSSILSKGPFGLIIPCLIIGVYYLISRKIPDKKKIFYFFLILTISITIGCLWYYLAYTVSGESFLIKQILNENINRVVKHEGDNRGHYGPFYLPFIFIFSISIPWSLFAPRLYYGFKSIWKNNEYKDKDLIILSISFLLVFLLATLISVSKRSVYLLPCLPFLSYLIVISLIRSKDIELKNWVLSFEKIIFKIILVILSLVILLLPLTFYIKNNLTQLNITELYFIIERIPFYLLNTISLLDIELEMFVILLSLFSLRKTFTIINQDPFRFLKRISLVTIVLFYSTQIIIATKVQAQMSAKPFIQEVNKLVDSEDDNYIFQLLEDNFAASFYLNKFAPVYNDINEILDICLNKKPTCNKVFILGNEKFFNNTENQHDSLLKSKHPLIKLRDKLCLVTFNLSK